LTEEKKRKKKEEQRGRRKKEERRKKKRKKKEERKKKKKTTRTTTTITHQVFFFLVVCFFFFPGQVKAGCNRHAGTTALSVGIACANRSRKQRTCKSKQQHVNRAKVWEKEKRRECVCFR
jgi:hypothetical protein